MQKITFSFRALGGLLRRGSFIVAGAVLAAVFAAGVAPAQPAQAAGCRHYTTSMQYWQIAPSGDDTGTWYYGATVWVPSWSGCRDINLPRKDISPCMATATRAPLSGFGFTPEAAAATQTAPNMPAPGTARWN